METKGGIYWYSVLAGILKQNFYLLRKVFMNNQLWLQEAKAQIRKIIYSRLTFIPGGGDRVLVCLLLPHRVPAPEAGGGGGGGHLVVELQTKVRNDFTITEKAPTKAFSW